MSAKNELMHKDEAIFKKFMRLPVFIVLGVAALAMFLGVMPAGMIGGMCFLLPLALILQVIGAKVPILKDYLGGSPLLLIFFGAGLVYFHVIPQASVDNFSAFMRNAPKNNIQAKHILEENPEQVTTFLQEQTGDEELTVDSSIGVIKSSGANFLNFYICGLIAGAIFGINSKLLVKAGVRYVVPLAACILACCGLAAVAGGVMGFGWKDSIFKVAFPILGGGMGGGAVPMATVVHDLIGQDMKEILSAYVPALALGNVFAIIGAGLLDRLGQKYPSLSGDGEILKDSEIKNIEPQVNMSIWNLVIGLAVSTGFFAFCKILNHFVPQVHQLAFMIIAVATCKVAGIIPEYIIVACYSWFRFIVKAFTGIILLAIGIVFTDLNAVITAITPIYVVLCACVVLASILGAGLAGRLVGFNFVESAITAGLCMANMGGTGDVAVLSASRRMELMPFARFSTSIGGGFIIILCGVLVPMFYDKI